MFLGRLVRWPLLLAALACLASLNRLEPAPGSSPFLPLETTAPVADAHGLSLRGAFGPFKVGVQAGHLDIATAPDEMDHLRTSLGASWRSVREVDLNVAVATEVVAQLRSAGVLADLVPAVVPPSYDADAFVSIHADGANRPGARGWKIGVPWGASAASRQLQQLMSRTYAHATGLPHDEAGTTYGMRGYYGFSPHRYQHAIARTTPAVLVEMGFVTDPVDRAFLLSNTTTVARGISDGVLAYLHQRDPYAILQVVPPPRVLMQVLEDVPLLVGPRAGAARRATLPAGTLIQSLDAVDGWHDVLVRRSYQVFGWIPAAALAPLDLNDPRVLSSIYDLRNRTR